MMVPVYLLFAWIGDRKKGRFVPIISLCIMLIALLNVILIGDAGSYRFNMCLFYFTIAAFTSYYLLTFWRLAPSTKQPALWAPFGRIIDSGAVLLTGAIHLSSLPPAVMLGLDIAGVALIILLMALGGSFDISVPSVRQSEEPAESISERLSIQVRTLQNHVTRIYRKVGVTTRPEPSNEPPSGPKDVDELDEEQKELYDQLAAVSNSGGGTVSYAGRTWDVSIDPDDLYLGCPVIRVGATCTTWGYHLYLPCVLDDYWWMGELHRRKGLSIAELTKGAIPVFEYTTPPRGHDFDVTPYIEEHPAATCTAPGLTVKYCAHGCGESICYIVPANGHTIRFEQYYKDIDGDGREDIIRRIYCERCGQEWEASIYGGVYAEGNKADIYGANISLTDSEGHVTQATHMNGDFAYFANLAPGRYIMTAAAEGYVTRFYTVEIGNGMQEAKVYLNTTGNYGDEGFIDIQGAAFAFSQESYVETGEPLTPPVTVSYGGVVLTEGADYTVEYSSNVSPGYGYAKIKGIGAFKGHYNAPSWITPKAPDDPGESPQVQGDVSADGVLDGRDLLRMAKYLAGIDVEINIASADFNGDGNVGGRDLLRMAKYLAGV